MLEPDDKALALDALRTVLRDPKAKAADKLRAAESMLRYEQGAPVGDRALHERDDQELLALARGEGGAPPVEGPAAPRAVAVPSHPDRDPTGRIPNSSPLAGPDHHVPRETPSPMLKRDPAGDPKEDPFANLAPMGPKKESMGPKKGPELATGTQNRDDPDPWE